MLLWVLVTLFAFCGVVNSAPPGPNKNGGQLVNPPNDVEEFVFSFEDNNNRGGITIPLDQQLSSLVKKLNDAKSDSLKIREEWKITADKWKKLNQVYENQKILIDEMEKHIDTMGKHIANQIDTNQNKKYYESNEKI